MMLRIDQPEPSLYRERKPLREWSKFSLLRAVDAAGGDAEALRLLPVTYLRSKLLINVSERQPKHELNRSDLYVLNEYAVRHVPVEQFLREGNPREKLRSGFLLKQDA